MEPDITPPQMFNTGDTILSPVLVSYMFEIENQDYLILAMYQCIEFLTEPDNWRKGGDAEVDTAVERMTDLWFSLRQVPRMVGTIMAWAGDINNLPYGALLCDGSTYARTAYPSLYAVLDPVFIIDADNFRVPDMRGRVAIGVGTGSGLSPRAMDDTLGEETHVLVETEMPAHSHSTVPHSHSEGIAVPAVAQITVVPQPSAVPGVGVTGPSGVTVNSTGGDGAHNNMQPSIALLYLIVAV